MEKQESYISKRDDTIHDVMAYTISDCLNCYFNVEYRHTDRLEKVRDKPFILLPKHQSLADISLEGRLLLQTIGRRAHYIMKSSLPGLLGYVGGISISRMKDMGEYRDRKELRDAIRKANQQKAQVYNVIETLLRQGDIVVIHPEGTRNYQKVGYSDTAVLGKLLSIQKRIGQTIPFVTLDLCYESKKTGWLKEFRSKITITVGEPFETDDLKTLEERIAADIRLIGLQI